MTLYKLYSSRGAWLGTGGAADQPQEAARGTTKTTKHSDQAPTTIADLPCGALQHTSYTADYTGYSVLERAVEH